MRTLLILLTGIIAGVLIAGLLRQQPQPTAQVQEPAPVPETITPQRLAPATVTVHGFRSGAVMASVPATMVMNNSTLIAPISGFVGARKLVVESANGFRADVRDVLAADEISDLAILGTVQPVKNTRVLQPEADGSLHLGREVQLLTNGNPYQAVVAAAGVRDELGAYNYRIDIRSVTGSGVATAIVDPDSGMLLGFIRGAHSATSAMALDSNPVNTLLARAKREPALTPAAFSSHYYERTNVGRLAWLRHLVSVGEYRQALEFGRETLHLDAHTLRHGTLLMRQAYAAIVARLLKRSAWGEVLAILDDADTTVGLDDKLRLLRSETRQTVGNLRGALDDLLGLSDPEPHRVRMLVIENALAAGHDGGTSLALLERALQDDPGYAPYHRLRGELLANRGDMAGAIAALEQAITLDPSMRAEVEPLLGRLHARRKSPPLTEVPIQRRRSTLYVNTRINDSTQTFRFLLDTGASYTAITTETALRLGIRNIFLGAPVVELETANGRVYATTATLQAIDVNGARVENVEAVILESMSGVDGLLGQSFLRHFDVSIDRTRGVIAFSRRIGD